MADALTIAIQSMQNDLQRLDAISQNVANVNTPGYRRTISVTRPFEQVMTQSVSATRQDSVSLSLPSVTTAFDTSPGAIKNTGKRLDIAISGDGYFELTTPTGPAYTRSGSFQMDDAGRFVSLSGLTVNGTAGEIVANAGTEPTISSEGEITVGDTVIGHLRIVRFEDAHSLVKGTDGLLHQLSTAAEPVESKAHLVVGSLESANVAPLNEMVSMMETARHFESQQKLFQGYDEQISTAIQKLAQF